MRHLIVSILKNDYFRTKGTLFWNFLFPILLYLILVSIFGDMPSNMNLKIGLVGKSSIAESVFKNFPSGIEIVETKDPEKDLRYGKIDVCVILPENFDNLFTKAIIFSKTKISVPVEITVLYAPERQESVVLANVVSNILESLDLQLRKVKEVEVEYRRKERQTFNYSRYILPAILLVGVMSVGLFTVPYQLALYREQGILKRILASPLRDLHYFFSIIVCGLFAMSITSASVTLFARFVYRVEFPVNSSFLSGVLLSFLTFLSVSLLMVSLFRTFSALSAASQVFNQVFMFLGGFYFDVSGIPWPIKAVVLGNPATYLVDYLRGSFGYRTIYSNHFLVPIVWIVLSFVLFLWNWRRVMVVE